MRHKAVEFEDFCNITNSIKTVDDNLLKEIYVFQETMKAKREKERVNNMKTISELCKSVKKIAMDVQDSKKVQNLDVNHLRIQLKNIQEHIQGFKTQNELHLKRLQEEEKHLKSEVEKFASSIDSYENAEEVKVLSIPKIKPQFILETKSEEVVQFEKFLADHGGHYGEWEEEDHLLFLQLRHKYRQKSLFIKALQTRLPGLSEKDVQKHEKWYTEYLNLRDKQRHAIHKWRTEKERERSKQRAGAAKPASLVADCNEQAKLERKNMVEEWKRKRMELKKQNEEEIQRARQQQMQKDHEKRQLQEMKRAAVEVYKKEKMCQQNAHLLMQQLKELKEREESAAQANMLLKSFRQQDEIYIERRRLYKSQAMQRKESGVNKWMEARRRVSLSVERDPGRLLRPTLSWNNRLLNKASEPTKPVLNLRNMPHLAVPSWRKGLTS